MKTVEKRGEDTGAKVVKKEDLEEDLVQMESGQLGEWKH